MSMSAGESYLTPSESEVLDLKRSISLNLRVESWRKDGAFAFSSFRPMRSQLSSAKGSYSTMSSDRRQEAHIGVGGMELLMDYISRRCVTDCYLRNLSPPASAPLVAATTTAWCPKNILPT
jgi:hypothetical protein